MNIFEPVHLDILLSSMSFSKSFYTSGRFNLNLSFRILKYCTWVWEQCQAKPYATVWLIRRSIVSFRWPFYRYSQVFSFDLMMIIFSARKNKFSDLIASLVRLKKFFYILEKYFNSIFLSFNYILFILRVDATVIKTAFSFWPRQFREVSLSVETYIYIYKDFMGAAKSYNNPKETHFIHVKISKYEGRPVSIIADRNLYRWLRLPRRIGNTHPRNYYHF